MIKVAIVGTGNIAPAHVQGILTFPDRCRIVALCDIYPEKAENMKKKYGLDCRVYGDFGDMLVSEEEIGLVHICTPPFTHAKLAVQAMDAGCNWCI